MTSIEATLTSSSAQLQQLIRDCAAPGGLAVADLSLGSWEPQALALQILGQASGRELGLKQQSRGGAAAMPLGDAMSGGIDQEGRGNASLRGAFQAARQIGTLLRRSRGAVLVIAPAFGIGWRREDRLLIEYLARDWPDVSLRFAVLAGSDCAWPEDWAVTLHDGAPQAPSHGGPDAPPTDVASLLGRLPGAIAPTQLAQLGEAARAAVLVLRNGWALARPEWRCPPNARGTSFSRAEVERVRTQGPRHGAAYVLHHGPAAEGDCWAFCREAWRHFDGGYRELAFLCIDRAHDGAPDDTTRGVFECHRQAMRLASAGYAAAGALPRPEAGLSDEMRGFLLQTKGWGLVMDGHAEAALPCLREALSLCAPAEPDVPFMFLLNITALAEVRSGHADAAYALEQRIERTILEHGLDNARLQFVNWMNLARLERYAGRLDEAERYYRLAFSTVEGARTEADSVNANLCIERIEAARGQPRAALVCLVRAALHWVAGETPEALNWRIQGLILGQRVAPDVAGLDEATQAAERIAAAMLAKLRQAASACGIELPCDAAGARGFAYLDQAHAGARPHRYLGGDGWAVMAATGALAKPDFGPQHRALRGWLAAWVMQTGDAEAGCFLIDRSLGSEMPVDEEQMRASAAACGVAQLVFDGRHSTLDLPQRAMRLSRRRLQRNPIVARLDREGSRTVVHYRRYFTPQTLTADESALLSASADEPELLRLEARLAAADWSPGRIERTLADLQKRRVLRMCSAARA